MLILSACFASNAKAQSREQNIPRVWLTPAESTDYRTTPRYDETVSYLKRLAAASPLIRLSSFGETNQGRSLPLVIASKNDFTPAAARNGRRQNRKAIILIQACIHAGESDGKDAGLALLRDIAITKTETDLLNQVVLLFIPIYNADGHERFSPYNRLNQNGPEAMGWRANATNLNLNRDYMKADAPETRAWLKLWNEWQPDLFIDAHTTDGADFQYNVTYQFENHAGVNPNVRRWMTDAFTTRIFPAAERQGNLLAPYIQLRDNRDLAKGMDLFIATPRFATGYVPLLNRPALLIETHSLKPYRSRVRGTYDLIRATLREINRDTESLLNAVRAADRETIETGARYDATRKVALRFALSEKSEPFEFKGLESRTAPSRISGAQQLIYTDKKLRATIPFYADAQPAVSITPPLAYVVPAEWQKAIDVLRAHHVKLKRTTKDVTTEMEIYRVQDLKFVPVSFENRVPVTYQTKLTRERRTLAAGSYIVELNQPAALVAIHLLEPDAPDSLMRWGFFNSKFEQKEYGEDYVLEKLAVEMLARDANLKREFEERLKNDSAFAASAAARLRFFHERSPYWDTEINVYPVMRLATRLAESNVK